MVKWIVVMKIHFSVCLDEHEKSPARLVGTGIWSIRMYGFYGASTSKIIGARMQWFLMIMMANDIRRWMWPVFPTFVLRLRKKPWKKTQPGKQCSNEGWNQGPLGDMQRCCTSTTGIWYRDFPNTSGGVSRIWFWGGGLAHGRLVRCHRWSACDVGEATEGWRTSCDVGEATEGFDNELWRRWSTEGLAIEENELWRRWSDGRVVEWAEPPLPTHSVGSPTSRLILQSFCRLTYVTAHSLTLPSPTWQLILESFCRFTYVTGTSLTSSGEPPMVSRLF